MIINNLVPADNKSYLTQRELIRRVEEKLGTSGVHSDYDLIIITTDNGRYVPIIKFRKPFEYRIGDAIHAGFYTIN
jgi:hypothetical protein